LIRMEDVWKAYPNGVMAVNGINVHVEKGEFVYIVGPSGSGKSTFIKMMYHEVKPSRGKIIIDGLDLSTMKNRQVPILRRKVGVVFQDFKLLPKLSVYENVAFALEVIEEHPKQIRKKVMEVLDLVKLKHKARSMPNELSGGEQQRISIARSIVNNPSIVVADEPTGNLDPDNAWSIMEVFEQINARGTTILMATHNKDIVNEKKQRVIAIEGGMIVRDEAKGEYGYEA
jgi:cell division transport system ATP-binding protein